MTTCSDVFVLRRQWPDFYASACALQQPEHDSVSITIIVSNIIAVDNQDETYVAAKVIMRLDK